MVKETRIMRREQGEIRNGHKNSVGKSQGQRRGDNIKMKVCWPNGIRIASTDYQKRNKIK